MRLFFERVPEAVAQERRRRLKRDAAKGGTSLSPRAALLAGWTIALTTVPSALLSREEALILLRLRWQIELLFKRWKEQGLLDEWRTKKANRILCEIYAKLIGLLLQQWLLIVSCWHQPHRSLVKAAKAVRQHVVLLSTALTGDLCLLVALRRIQRAAQAGSRLNSRQEAPNTSQMLMTGHNQWSSKPLRTRRLK
jgi:DDE family transposase